MVETYPLLLKPAYKHYVWGGRRIVDHFSRPPQNSPCAESWEVSDREEGMSLIQNGPFEDTSLKELIQISPEFFSNHQLEKFPLLIKLIDAQDALSIQVHPDDMAAPRFGGEPKSEMWYIVDAEPGSYIYLGLKENLTKEELERALEEGTIERYMNQIPVSAGETFYIPGGLIHSIGKGCLIYEVQQNSNTTYRLYDWGRVDANGRGRDLHLKKGLEVLLKDQQVTTSSSPKVIFEDDSHRVERLVSTPYFTFSKWTLDSIYEIKPTLVFQTFFLLSGKLAVRYGEREECLCPGQSYLIPPNLYGVEFIPLDGEVCLLETKPIFS